MQDTVHDRPHPHPTSAAMSASPGSVKRRRIDLSTEDDSLPPVDEAEAAAALDVDPAASASPSSSPDGGSAARPQRKAKMEASSRVHAMAFSLQDETEVGGRRRSSNNNAYTSKSSSRRRATTNGAAGHSRKRPLEISDDDVAEEEADEMEVEEDEEEPADAVDADEDAAMEEAPRPAAASKHAGSKSATRHPSPSTTAAAASASAPAAASSSAPAAAASSSTTTHSRPRAAHAEAALKAAAAAASSAPHAHTIIPEKKSGHHSNSHRAAAASSSSSSSFSNGGEAKPKKQRDLRRDKRISGFGAWKVVHKSSIPAMTYEGYEDLATETLEKETQAAVKQSLPYTPQGTDAYHRDPTDILTGKAEQPLTLMRRVDTRCGREEYKVKALRTIEPREVVTFLGGRLMESVKANKQQREEWNQHFHMNRKWLKEFFEYPGAHDLVVSTKNHRTIASYIRSPEERDDEGEGPNLKVRANSMVVERFNAIAL
jgi:hypothetical protein